MSRSPVSYVERWPLMNPNELLFIIVIYLVFVLKVGRVIMDSCTPFKMNKFLVFYNMFKMVNSSILTYQFFDYIKHHGLFPRRCDHDESVTFLIGVMYWKYMITKVLDLLDTIFFVLRKKYQQISFLHVYHHTIMVLMTWASLKYDPSDHWAFMAVSNCAVHTVMYMYYMFSAMGPKVAKYLWWKKYLTALQIAQFVLIGIHLVIQTQISPCPVHDHFYWVGIMNLMLFIGLFADFYRKRYIAKDQNRLKADFGCSHVD